MDIRNTGKKSVFSTLEMVKWLSIIALLVMLVIGNYLCCSCNVLLRGVVHSLIVVVICYIILITNIGRLFIKFSRESYIELNQVVWPTYQDAFNTTLIVIAVTAVMSLVFWGLDTGIVYAVSVGLKL